MTYDLRILQHLADEGPDRVATLATVMGMPKNRTAEAVTRLHRRGLVQLDRQTKPGGRFVALTPAGLAVAPE